MKPITNGKRQFLIISIEKDAFDFNIEQGRKQKVLSMSLKRPNAKFGFSEFKVSLRTNKKLTLFGKLSELTEEQAHNLVHETYFDGIGYPHKDYLRHKYDLYSAKASLHSLFQSNDCWLKEWVSSNVCDFCQFEKRSVSCTPTGVDSGCEGIGCDLANDIYNEKISKASEDFLIILID